MTTALTLEPRLSRRGHHLLTSSWVMISLSKRCVPSRLLTVSWAASIIVVNSMSLFCLRKSSATASSQSLQQPPIEHKSCRSKESSLILDWLPWLSSPFDVLPLTIVPPAMEAECAHLQLYKSNKPNCDKRVTAPRFLLLLDCLLLCALTQQIANGSRPFSILSRFEW